MALSSPRRGVTAASRNYRFSPASRASAGVFWLILTLLLSACFSGGSASEPTPVGPRPPELILRIQELADPSVNWNSPKAVVVTEESLWVLDSGRNRILNLNTDGEVLRILCERDDCERALDDPLGMDTFQDRLYVANTGAGNIVVLTFDGEVDRTIELPPGSQDTPRPADIVISPDGDFYVSDEANGRVVHFDPSGQPLETLETSDPEDPRYRLLRPLGLALGSQGDLYVADVDDGRVKRFTPTQRFVEEYLMNGVADYSDPLDVEVDRYGNVFFTDDNHRAVQVFTEAGRSAGILGLVDHSRVDSPFALRSPYGLFFLGDVLYITDQDGALFAYKMDPEYWGWEPPK